MKTLKDALGLGEPVLDVLGRIAKFAMGAGAIQDFEPLASGKLLSLVIERGVDVRVVHSIHAASHPHRVALVDDQTSLTYAEADLRINQIANALAARGVTERDRVLLILENRVDYVLTWFALFRLGASAIHTSYRATCDEIDFLLQHSGARFLLSSALTREAASSAAERQESSIVAWDVDGTREDAFDFGAEVSSASTAPPIHRRDGRGDSVVYTSGTTGRPKGALRDFTSFGLVELSRLLVGMPVHFGDRHLVVSPLYHSAAQAFTLIHSALGGTVYLHAHFEPEAVLKTLHQHRIHSMFMVPTMTRRVLELPEATLERFRPNAFRMLVSGAAPFPNALRECAIAYFGPDAVFDFYGATELGWVTLINGREMREKPGSVGRPLPGQAIRIVDPESRATLEAGTVGIIYVKNAQTMAGYLDDAAATAETRDGEWLTVDDLGYLDDDGYLFLAGRDRDMIISGGVNIYPIEIEDALGDHPDIREVAVVGIPDENWGERVAGVVAGKKSMSRDDIDSWARNRLSGYKVPREWYRVPELPRNATGKVLKQDLRELILNDLLDPIS